MSDSTGIHRANCRDCGDGKFAFCAMQHRMFHQVAYTTSVVGGICCSRSGTTTFCSIVPVPAIAFLLCAVRAVQGSLKWCWGTRLTLLSRSARRACLRSGAQILVSEECLRFFTNSVRVRPREPILFYCGSDR